MPPGANTLIILGWPTSTPKLDAGSAGKEVTEPKEVGNAHSRQGGSETKAEGPTSDAPAVRLESNADTSQAPQMSSERAAPQDQPASLS